MKEAEENKEYYVATRNEKGEFLIYASETFKLSEIELINLIKICLVEQRSKSIGKKILSAYRDSTEHRKHITLERLKQIGVNDDGNTKPTIDNKSKTK